MNKLHKTNKPVLKITLGVATLGVTHHKNIELTLPMKEQELKKVLKGIKSNFLISNWEYSKKYYKDIFDIAEYTNILKLNKIASEVASIKVREFKLIAAFLRATGEFFDLRLVNEILQDVLFVKPRTKEYKEVVKNNNLYIIDDISKIAIYLY